MAPERRELARRFVRRLELAEGTRKRVEGLHANGALPKNDVLTVYRGLFIQNVALFEAFLDELFRAMMLRTTPFQASVRPRVSVTSSAVLDELLKEGREFTDWLPYSRTVRRAGIYLVAGRPFSELPEPLSQSLTKISITRNALAHRSEVARKTFTQKVVGQTPLLPHERRPDAFLRSQTRKPPSPTRFEVLMTDLSQAANLLCH